MTSTSSSVTSTSRLPKRRSPRSNSVSGGATLEQGGVGGLRSGLFLDGEALAGQRRLAGEEVPRRDQRHVAGHRVAGLQEHHVAGDDRLEGEIHRPQVAQHSGAGAHAIEQLSDGVSGLVLLPEAEQAAGRDDAEDDQRIARRAHGHGEAGGGEQHEQDGALELRHEQAGEATALRLPKPQVLARLGAAARLRRGQPLVGGAEIVEEPGDRERPVGVAEPPLLPRRQMALAAPTGPHLAPRSSPGT
jgi:hypothetical protein